MFYGSEYYYFSKSDDHEKDKMERQIESFTNLSQGWSFGGGETFSTSTIKDSIRVYRIGKSFGLITEVFPGINGDITVSFQSEDNFLDIRINGDGTYDVEHEKGIGQSFTSNYLGHFKDLYDIREKIKWLRALKKKSLSEFLTYSILAKEEDGSGMMPLKYRKMETEFRYLMTGVEKNNTNIPYVNTFESSTPMLRAYR